MSFYHGTLVRNIELISKCHLEGNNENTLSATACNNSKLLVLHTGVSQGAKERGQAHREAERAHQATGGGGHYLFGQVRHDARESAVLSPQFSVLSLELRQTLQGGTKVGKRTPDR